MLARLFAAAGALALALGSAGAAAQTFPTDEARLYEAAKKEGKLVWYESAPLEAMKAVAAEFEKKYPGVKVEVLRIVGVAQYQQIGRASCRERVSTDV